MDGQGFEYRKLFSTLMDDKPMLVQLVSGKIQLAVWDFNG